MNKLRRLFYIFLMVNYGLFCQAQIEPDKFIRIYRNGEVLKSFRASEIDYIEIEDYVATPEEVKATPEESSITISWLPVEGAVYSVYRSVDNLSFGLLAEGIEEAFYVDESPIPGISYYRVVATVKGVVSECSESVEAGLFFPVDVTTCSTEAIDLSVAIWKENQRFYLTPDQFLNADMREVRVEGLAVKTRAGEFIISPTL